MMEIRLDHRMYKEEIEKLRTENENLRKAYENIQNENKEMKQELKSIKNDLEWIEKEQKTNNVVITGLIDDTIETSMLSEVINNLIEKHLEIKINAKKVQKLGKEDLFGGAKLCTRKRRSNEK